MGLQMGGTCDAVWRVATMNEGRDRREPFAGAASSAGDDQWQGGPAAVVLAQDACIGDGWLDVANWTGTVFFPLALLSSGGTIVIEDDDAFALHLRELQQTARLRGAVGLRTRIISQNLSAPNMAIVTSHRDHLNELGEVVTSSSITWSLILTPSGWRINQIHFNDSRNDPSVVSEMIRNSEGAE